MYLLGIALIIVGFIFGVVILGLHYGTACSSSNMFACHSLFRPSSSNPVPYFAGGALLVFIVGLVLSFIYSPRLK